SQHVIFTVCEGLARGHHDALTRVNHHRIEILHVTNGHTVVETVSNDLILDLLPSVQELLNEYLTAMRQRFGRSITHLRWRTACARAESAQRIGGSQHHRVSNLCGRAHRVVDGRGYGAPGNLHSDL